LVPDAIKGNKNTKETNPTGSNYTKISAKSISMKKKGLKDWKMRG
jgi:hypothetical protein